MKQMIDRVHEVKVLAEIKNTIYIILSIYLFLFLSYILFKNLGYSAIADWDEARHGVNAYEMLKNKNFIVTTYAYQIDYWNLKPPLSEYFIILGYQIFGYNAFGLRFYSAFAMFLCAIVCFLFSLKKIGKVASLWILIAFMISSPIIFDHCARSGDADSLYLLLSTIAIIGLLINKENMKGFYFSCLCFSFAFLTKSWHAGSIALIIISYFFINIKKLKINIKKILLASLFALIPIFIWGIFRFSNDGIKFFKEMIEYDLLKRTKNALEGHTGGILYYFNYLLQCRGFAIFILLSFLSITLNKQKMKVNNEIRTLLLSIIIPFVIFSIAKTKLYWYIFCIFPPIIILSAYSIQRIYEIKSIGKYIIFIILAGSSLTIIYNNSKYLRVYDENYLFTILKRNQEYAEKNVYLYECTENENWDQKKLLSVELAGDMKAINGGYISWKEDDDAYILINSLILESIEEPYETIVSGKYSLLKHKKE